MKSRNSSRSSFLGIVSMSTFFTSRAQRMNSELLAPASVWEGEEGRGDEDGGAGVAWEGSEIR